jgi:sugar lactone lactonase YvrE
MQPRLIVSLLLAAIGSAVLPAGPTRAQNISTYATVPGAQGLAFDPSGNLYVTSGGATRGVYKVPPGGGPGVLFATTGFVDPWGIVCDASGNVFVADRGNPVVANSGKIMQVTPAGVVTTFKSSLAAPFGLTIDANGNLYAGLFNAQKVIKITPSAGVTD